MDSWLWYCCSSCSFCCRVKRRVGGLESDPGKDSEDVCAVDGAGAVAVAANEGEGGGLEFWK